MGALKACSGKASTAAVMRKARMYMCAMQALCGTTLPSASGRSAFCVAAGFKDAPNHFCWRETSRPNVDTAFEQIRHYAVNDIAVSLRLLRALSDLAATTDDEPMYERLVLRGRRIVAGCATWVDASNSKRLERRLAELEARAPTTTLT